jgi:hypothetical protein
MKKLPCVLVAIGLSQFVSCSSTKEALKTPRQVREELAKSLSTENGLTPWLGSFKQPAVGHIYEMGRQQRPSQLTNMVSVYNTDRNWNLFSSQKVSDTWSYVVNKDRKLALQLAALGMNLGGEYTAVKDVTFSASADTYDSVQNILGLEAALNDNIDLFPGLADRLKRDRSSLAGRRDSKPEDSGVWIITGVASVKDLSLKITHDKTLGGTLDASEGVKKLLDVGNVTASAEGHLKSSGTLIYSADGNQKVAVELRPLLLEKQEGGRDKIVIYRPSTL